MLLLGGLAGRGMAADIPLFSDDFTTAALLAEKWKLLPASHWQVANGVLTSPARKGSRTAIANLVHTGAVSVHVRVKALAFTPGQWCGVTVRGVHFTLRPDCFWYVYNIHDKKRALGGQYTGEKPEAGRWYAFEIVHRNHRFQWFVDGRKMADFTEPNEIRGAETLLALASSGSPIAYDDVQVLALADNPNASPNLLSNSSFEVVTDHIPNGWTPRFISAIPPERLWRDWGVDTTCAFVGRQSLRIVGFKEEQGNGFFSVSRGIAVGKPCTFSVYLKADHPGCRARLGIWEWLGRWHFQTITLTTDWQRYAITVEAPEKNLVRGGLRFQDDGVLWADAAQLEVGAKATPYRPSERDGEEERGGPAALPVPPPLPVYLAAAAPVLDGKLDDAVWSTAARAWPLVLPGGKKPTGATDAYVLFADDTLYVGMRCHDANIDQLKASVRQRDGNVFADDTIEILLDTNHDQTTYYHLAFNPLGTRFDAGPGRNRAWNGDWQVKTHVDKTFWSAEVALPLAMFDITPPASDRWGLNLCRSRPRLGEFASTAVTSEANFHVPRRYPVLQWPSREIFRPYLLLPAGMALVEAAPNRYRLEGTLKNRTGRQQTVTVSGKIAGAAWDLGVIELAAGATHPFAVPIAKPTPPDATTVKVSGTIRRAETPPKLLRSFSRAIPVQPLFECVLERSVYATEPEAGLMITVRLGEDELRGARIRVLDKKQGNPLAEFTELRRDMTGRFPLADIAPGTHPLQVQLVDAGGTIRATVAVSLRKLPASQPAVALDRTRRCLVVDGRPYLVLAPLYGIQPRTPLATVDRLINHCADSGFTTVMIVGKLQPEDQAGPRWERVFTRAAERNIKVIAWPGAFPKVPLDEVGRFIDRWKTHPALLAWMPVDEPELYTDAETTRKTLRFYRERDPYHPVYMNNTIMGIPSRFANLPGDIVSMDDYLTNRPNREVAEIVHDVDVMNEIAAPMRRPVWMFVVGNNLHNHIREPSAGEQVAQTYGCILAGASGLKYFLGNVISPKHWSALQRTNRELLTLAPVLFSRETAPAAHCVAREIRFTTRRVGADIYLLAVNLSKRPVTAEFSLEGMRTTDALVLFEGRMTRVIDGVLTETFAPHQRHVYRIFVP